MNKVCHVLHPIVTQFVGCCLATKSLHLNNTKWNRLRLLMGVVVGVAVGVAAGC